MIYEIKLDLWIDFIANYFLLIKSNIIIIIIG